MRAMNLMATALTYATVRWLPGATAVRTILSHTTSPLACDNDGRAVRRSAGTDPAAHIQFAWFSRLTRATRGRERSGAQI